MAADSVRYTTTPDGVVVPASLRTTLERLLARSGSAVALVSGRTIPTLDRLFQPLALPAIGGHGAEMRLNPDGAVIKRHPPGLSDAVRQRPSPRQVAGARNRRWSICRPSDICRSL